MESTLKNLRGVLDVKAKVLETNLGEAEIVYNPAEVSVDAFKQAIPTTSGEKHNFIVVSVFEEG